ncbi:hypothetical protein [Stutzerimonas stutzeri]|uniref:hypothetical protein n=1 Tax=Stutzerimonas stutzeri TaxID=316 RepID=UPI0018EEF096|nr:hypothetical protein [Stutzerimonas stutzeri]
MEVNLEAMFFSGWSTPLRTLVVGLLAYIGLIGLLRISGRRSADPGPGRFPLPIALPDPVRVFCFR